MRIGVDYYPEHWDRSLWEADADLMKETGVQVVRLAEFAWSRLEPREGEFDFAWLDEAVKILPAMRSPTVIPLAQSEWCSLQTVVDENELWTIIEKLKAIGAEGILVLPLEKIVL